MNYEDNPRKVYGKVEIVYADEELSNDVKAEVSGNSQISHPKEVYHLPSEPTVKACTMDGNSTMDGTFQMMGDDLIVGWWSDKGADINGVFENKPYIELTFMMRPIIYWRIIGDKKLGQYPVDFTVQYKRNGVVIKTDVVIGNTNVEIVLEPRIEDITAIRLTIEKWSHPNAVAKILRFFERVYEKYEGNSILSFEVGEELCSSDGNYNINSDTMVVNIYNEDRKFDKGYLRRLMLLDRKLYPYIGIEKDGEIEYKPLGVFYSDEWDIPQDSQWVKCTATDRLMRLQIKTYLGFPLVENVSLYEIAEDILYKVGLSKEEYKITDKLKDFVVPMALLPKTTGWDALQEIANAGLCKIFVDRENRITITCEEDTADLSTTEINPSNMFSHKSNITLTEFSNCVSVDYCDISIKNDIIDVVELEMQLEPNEIRTLALDYTSEIAYPNVTINQKSVLITLFESGVNSCTCVVKNDTASTQTAVLTISGNAIEINTQTVIARDEESIRQYGLIEYSHPTSELVQSKEQAEYMAKLLLNKMKAGEGSITTIWRGNPELEVGLAYDCTDRFGYTDRLLCEYNKFTYDGGLQQETRGRKIRR